MEKVDLMVSLEAERLDALKFFMATKENTDPQTELQKALTQMYETYVPADTRAYLDSKLKPAAGPKPRPRRTDRQKTPRQQRQESETPDTNSEVM